jgi:hypothetical protein
VNLVQEVLPLVWNRYMNAPLSGITFGIVQLATTIGRDKSNAIAVLDPKVSRLQLDS